MGWCIAALRGQRLQQCCVYVRKAQHLSSPLLRKPLRSRRIGKGWQVASPHGPQGRRARHVHRFLRIQPSPCVGIGHLAGHDALWRAAPGVVRYLAQVLHQAQR